MSIGLDNGRLLVAWKLCPDAACRNSLSLRLYGADLLLNPTFLECPSCRGTGVAAGMHEQAQGFCKGVPSRGSGVRHGVRTYLDLI